jgi:sterol desaturase/sphingolipid hydroxylase (fatty acid hydroxylase superfamily)
MLGSNLRHSHIWMGFGPVLSYVFISPAQHQVHHSRAAEHHNKNYGEIFAFWDFMFGTLYVPQGEEKLEFGLADKQGRLLPQPHNTLREAVFQPFQASAKAIRRRMNVSR